MDGDEIGVDDAVHFLPEEHLNLFQRIVMEQVDDAISCGVSHPMQEAVVHLTTPDTTLLEPYYEWFDLEIEALYPANESFGETDANEEIYRLVYTPDETVEHASADELSTKYRSERIDDQLAETAPLECPECNDEAVKRRREMYEGEDGFTAGGAPLLCGECEWAAEVDTDRIATMTDAEPSDVAARIEAAITTGHVPDDLAESMSLGVKSDSDTLV